MKKAIIIIAVLIFAKSISAQKATLEELVKIAFENNKDIKTRIHEVDFQKEKINTAFDIPRTNFELQYGNIQNPGVFDYTIGGSQIFELPKVYRISKSYYEKLAKSKEVNLMFFKSELRYRLNLEYYNLSNINKIDSLLNSEINKLSEIEKVYQKKYELGESDKGNLIAIGLKKKELGLKILNNTNIRNNLLSNLKILLGVSQLPEILFEDNNINIFIPNTLINSKLEFLKSNIDAASESIKVAETKNLPAIKLGAMNQSMQRNYNQFVGIAGLEIPLYRKANNANIQSAKIQMLASQSEFESLEFSLIQETTASKQQLKNDIEILLKINQDILPQIQELNNINTSKYLSGEMEYIDWYIIYNQYVGYKLERETKQADINKTMSLLKFLNENE